ncbi:MAG: carbonic anhydrase [Leptonema sp. (in: Bacteria)]|nr:carbonic anhydrase [Leptonema sp. (in: bacteria)]
MEKTRKLLQGNKDWVAKMNTEHPGFFDQIANGQSPKFLWIGCSDSRVPASEITGQLPGSIFVHRNIANLVLSSDLNLLTVLHYSLFALGIRDVIVVGHHSCGGVTAALESKSFGFIEGWIGHIRNLTRLYKDELSSFSNHSDKINRLCEINVQEQVKNLEEIYFVKELVEAGETVRLHGWIYNLHDGLLKEIVSKSLSK